MNRFLNDGLYFNYIDKGEGIPFFFQHGLGGDVNQPSGLFTLFPGIRLVSFDCRGHGLTKETGNVDCLSFSGFADDMLHLMDHLNIARAVVGGISLGAGVALNFAKRYPDRVIALVLSRPAWLNGPMPEKNRDVYRLISELIRSFGPIQGKEKFKTYGLFKDIQRESSDTAQSLLKQFDYPFVEQTRQKFERLPSDAPNRNQDEWKGIQVPVLVLANKQDPIHPFEYGITLSSWIPNSRFVELTPKSVNSRLHAKETDCAIRDFLKDIAKK